MSKTSLCLTSLVAAVPGGWLATLMVLAFLSTGAGGWSIVVKGIAGALLLAGGFLAVMPVGILLFAGPKAEKPPKSKDKGEKAKGDETKAISAPAPAALAVEDEPLSSSDVTFEIDQDPRDSEEFVETIDQPSVEASSDDFDLGADFELDSVEEVDPNSKKRK